MPTIRDTTKETGGTSSDAVGRLNLSSLSICINPVKAASHLKANIIMFFLLTHYSSRQRTACECLWACSAPSQVNVFHPICCFFLAWLQMCDVGVVAQIPGVKPEGFGGEYAESGQTWMIKSEIWTFIPTSKLEAPVRVSWSWWKENSRLSQTDPDLFKHVSTFPSSNCLFHILPSSCCEHKEPKNEQQHMTSNAVVSNAALFTLNLQCYLE